MRIYEIMEACANAIVAADADVPTCIALETIDPDEADAVELPKGEWLDTTYEKLDEPQKQAVWHMVEESYREIGCPIKSVEDLKNPKYRLVMLLDTDGDQLPNACRFYRKKPAGNKFIMMGTDGSREAKRAAIGVVIELLKSPGWYAELSERPAEILESSGVPRIKDEETVRKALDGEDIDWVGDGYYTRDITGVGTKQKALYGQPNV